MILQLIPSKFIDLQHQPILDVSPNHSNLKQILTDMWETIYATKSIGLAAPQVGINLNLLIIDSEPLIKQRVNIDTYKVTMINPKIIDSSGMSLSYIESLCIGNSKESWVCIKYYDENFIEHTKKFHGTIARVIQQKYNYLEGKDFIDVLKSIQKKIAHNTQYNVALF